MKLDLSNKNPSNKIIIYFANNINICYEGSCNRDSQSLTLDSGHIVNTSVELAQCIQSVLLKDHERRKRLSTFANDNFGS